jgi:hypothetical protein
LIFLASIFFAFGEFDVLFGQGPILGLHALVEQGSSQFDAFISAFAKVRRSAQSSGSIGHNRTPFSKLQQMAPGTSGIGVGARNY